MASRFLTLFITALLVSSVLSSCGNLCATCSSDGKTCFQCKRGYQTQSGGYCQLSGTAGIIAGSIIGGALLFAIVIVGICVCINGWSRVFRIPLESTNVTAIDPHILETHQQIHHPVNEPVTVSNIPLHPILRNRALMQTYPTLTQAEQTTIHQAPMVSSTSNTCVVCMSPSVNVQVFPCQHRFHFGCLANWFNKRPSCPQCHNQTSEVKVQCNGCGIYKDSVTFCPPGCPNPNHKQCFLHLNSNRLSCKQCNRMRKSARISSMKSLRTSGRQAFISSLQYVNGGTITNLANMPTVDTLASCREITMK